jgi:DNA-binding transcriptional MerR regulator
MEDRSPHFRIGQLAAKTGVTPQRLRAWESRYGVLEPDRSSGNFRIYSREDEVRVRLMQRHLARGVATAEAAELARNGIVSPTPARLSAELPGQVAGRSLRLLRRGFLDYDEGTVERTLNDLFRAFTVEAVLRDAIFPFLNMIGDAWAEGVATAGQEHFASTLIESRLMSLARGWGTGTGTRALLACPAGENHTLGLVGFGIALARRGWRITFLGESTPASSIEHAARQTRPALVMLAASQIGPFEGSVEELKPLAAARRTAMAGAGASASLARRIGAEYVATDPVTAAESFAPARTGARQA